MWRIVLLSRIGSRVFDRWGRPQVYIWRSECTLCNQYYLPNIFFEQEAPHTFQYIQKPFAGAMAVLPPPSHNAVVVRSLLTVNPEERERILKDVEYNIFAFPAGLLTCDFLSDSGTSAMTDVQWAACKLTNLSFFIGLSTRWLHWPDAMFKSASHQYA